MLLLNVELSTRKNKRLVAVFKDDNRLIMTHFGYKSPTGDYGSTYIDHNDAIKRENYIARHGVNETWDDPVRPATLSRYLLWEKPNLKEAIASYRKRFNV